MAKVFTVVLTPHDGGEGIMLYQAKANSIEAAILHMRSIELIPKYDVASFTERPTGQFILGVLFPKLFANGESKVTIPAILKSYYLPFKCWLNRSHDTVSYQKYGKYCKRCGNVFPNESQ